MRCQNFGVNASRGAVGRWIFVDMAMRNGKDGGWGGLGWWEGHAAVCARILDVVMLRGWC